MLNDKILLIDDDIDDYLIMKDAIAGFNESQVLAYAPGGMEALDILNKKYQADGSTYELIVLDLSMPLRDGKDTLCAIRQDQRFRHIPVVIYSTYINFNDDVACKELGAIDCIIKPATVEEIAAVGKNCWICARGTNC